MRDGGSWHKDADWGEEFLIRYPHRGCDIHQEGRLEVVAFGIFYVSVAFSTNKAASSLADSVRYEAFKLREASV